MFQVTTGCSAPVFQPAGKFWKLQAQQKEHLGSFLGPSGRVLYMVPETTVGAPVGVPVCFSPLKKSRLWVLCQAQCYPHIGSQLHCTHPRSYRRPWWSRIHTRVCEGAMQTPAPPGYFHLVLIMTERKKVVLFYCMSPLCFTWETHLSNTDVRSLKMIVRQKLVNLLVLRCHL